VSVDPRMASRLSSRLSGRYGGPLFRAVDSRDGSAALGEGTYFTDSREAAMAYGDDVREFVARGLMVLGTNSGEYEMVRRRADGVRARHPSEAVAKVARMEGYDGIYSGPVFGLVVFGSGMSKVREVRTAGLAEMAGGMDGTKIAIELLRVARGVVGAPVDLDESKRCFHGTPLEKAGLRHDARRRVRGPGRRDGL